MQTIARVLESPAGLMAALSVQFAAEHLALA